MAAKQSAAVDAAERQWKKAPAESKPSALELARRHKVSESTIHRARARWARDQAEGKA